MLSVIIPSYREPLLQKTIDSLLDNSVDEIEVIAVVDGYKTVEPLKEDSRVKAILLDKNRGMRGAFNFGLDQADGDYIMKCDSHCLFAPGYDKALVDSCADNWLMIPRRYSLDDKGWCRDDSRPVRDYHYLTFPKPGDYGYGMHGKDWPEFSKTRKDILVDDTMSFQGSCWMANKNYFMDRVGFLDDRLDTYGSFAQEPQEIGLKYWLGGGRIKIIKKTWYAHLSKRKEHYMSRLYSRKHKKDPKTLASHTWSSVHWINNEEPGMIHPFSWLIEKFWPVPGWPENWKEVWKNYNL